MNLSYALLILKPDVNRRTLEGPLIMEIQNKFNIVSMNTFRFTPESIIQFYDFLKNEPFFSSLIADMSEKVCTAIVISSLLEQQTFMDSVKDWQGATNPVNALPGSMRFKYSKSIRQNTFHASDTLENFKKEMKIIIKLINEETRNLSMIGN